jgi:hypothetical protein
LCLAILSAVEFQKFGAVVAEGFGGGGVAAGDFCFARKEHQRGLPDIVAVQSAERPHHFGVKSNARNKRCSRGRGLVDNLDGVERVA